MSWQLLWCLAIACGPDSLSRDIAAPAYTKEQCIEEANRRLDREPKNLFICRKSNPGEIRRLIEQIRAGKTPEREPIEAVYIGPRTLSY